MLFALIGVAAAGVAGFAALWWLGDPSDQRIRQIFFLVPALIAVLAFYAWSVFRKLEDPDPTLATLRRRLLELQGTDQDRAKKGGA
jgi:hypothetical protein